QHSTASSFAQEDPPENGDAHTPRDDGMQAPTTAQSGEGNEGRSPDAHETLPDRLWSVANNSVNLVIGAGSSLATKALTMGERVTA
ncbi:unnamed protein product, partial [Amoebophrya sp. A25]